MAFFHSNYLKFALGACAIFLFALSSSFQAHAGKANNTLTWASNLEVNTGDRYYETTREGTILSFYIWDMLVYQDPVSLEFKPLLAKAHRWIDDLTLEFDLRDDVKFHNGQKFTADDVVYTINFAVNPDSKLPSATEYTWMKSAERISDYKVRIHLRSPFPIALDYLACCTPIYPHEYYAKVGTKGMSEKPIGTGPYKVSKFDTGKSVVFEMNSEYFSDSPKGKPNFKSIVYRTIPEFSTQLAELLSGGVDWIWRVPSDQVAKLAKIPNLQVKEAGIVRFSYIGFDVANRTGTNHPLTNKLVRQAVSHAIDREAIVRNLIKGDARVIHAACYPEQFGCTEDLIKYEYDPAKAKKLLVEAGFPNGFEIDLHGYRERPYTEAVIGYLREVGIKANLVWMQYPALRDKNYAGKTAFYHMTWGSSAIYDVYASTSQFFKFEGSDLARDPQVRDWLEIADTSSDKKVRADNYKKALQKIASEAYWLPMFTYTMNYAFTKDLDFTPLPNELPEFYLAKWK